MPTHAFDLTGKVAMVTGASRGLGQYMSLALARAGADVVVTSRDPARLGETVGLLAAVGRKAYPVALDVRDCASITRGVADALAAAGRIDILVNNAGCNVRKAAVDVTEADWDLVVDTNLKGQFFTAQAVARDMIPRRWGRIVNIGSVCCVAGYAGMAPYCASRGGNKQLTASLADDWGPFGITVNCLAPGWFKTAQTAVLYQDPAWVEYLTDKIPLKRPGQPADLDGMVVFLASDASEYVTGQTLFVDGGITVGSTRAMAKKR
ncbi:MAG: Gluconate 5-dehydrogenase [Phycisphaerae bacterium]|nr:Gluconate 5-dehydrogenase [Phycisphaerae bacterium]